MFDCDKNHKWTAKEVEYVLQVAQNIATVQSIDAPVGEDGDPLSVYLPDEEEESIEDKVVRKEMEETLQSAMKKSLTDVQYKVLMERYGFNGGVKSYREIAEMIGCSKQNVKIIEDNAVKKLRSYIYKKGLGDLFNG